MKRVFVLAAVSTLALLLGVRPARALDPSLDISQYAHTAWRVRDGFARGFIYSIAQTPDGYLWIGTEYGLLRFDGVRAIPWQPPAGQTLPSPDVSNLLVTRDGALWIGTHRGLARWTRGTLTVYAELQGERVSSLAQSRDGTVWIGTMRLPSGGRLCSVRAGHLECDTAFGDASAGVYPLLEDDAGGLLVGVGGGFWRWTPAPPRFFATAEASQANPGLGGDARGVLVGTDEGMARLANAHLERYSIAGLQPFSASRQPTGGPGMLRDRDGGLWIATRDQGVIHVHDGRAERFSEADGLSADTVVDLVEDREGSIWVATTGGIDRFREYVIPTFGIKQGLANTNTLSIVAGSDGSVWIATYTGVDRWKDGRIAPIAGLGAAESGRGRTSEPPARMFMSRALYPDVGGRLWVDTARGFGYIEKGRFVHVREVPPGWVFSVAELPAGHIWTSMEDRGLFEVVDGRVVRRLPLAALGLTDTVRVLLPDTARGGLWLGLAHGGVALFAGGDIQTSYSPAQGLGSGRVNHLRLAQDLALWAATQGGLSRIKEGQVSTLTRRNGLPCDTVHWSVEDGLQSVWLLTECGLVRIREAELQAWIADSARSVATTLFDSSDGVPSHTYPSEPHGVTRAPDRRIWFVNFAGISVIDPRNLRMNAVPPTVHIERIVADGEARWHHVPGSTGASNLRLPPRVRDLQIEYTALSLVAPEKVRFKYKLEGQDTAWREVINDRRVQYSNLPPGDYRFRVRAANNNGVWNEQGDSLQFSILPAYYQTQWFRALCGAGVLGVLWAGYRLRVRQLHRRFDATLDARVHERMRIARELHDTLLRSFHALLLRFQVVSELLADRPAVREKLDAAIGQAARAIAEGRDAVQGLRDSTIERNDLARAITTRLPRSGSRSRERLGISGRFCATRSTRLPPRRSETHSPTPGPRASRSRSAMATIASTCA